MIRPNTLLILICQLLGFLMLLAYFERKVGAALFLLSFALVFFATLLIARADD